jgi:UTP--glucose-1-phosphate uridylyltransferase
MRIRKAVFPVAGLGTRLLPASKVLAKELLPIIDRPLIQYAVDEAVEAGCDTLVFVINRYKFQIAEHFDRAFELERRLERGGKHEQLRQVREVIPAHVRTIFVTQSEALGLGHAVLCAAHAVGDEPFAVLLPDDLIWHHAGPGALKQMADHAAATGRSVVAVEDVPRDQTHRYGIVSAADPAARASRMDAIVEKPRPEAAPSTLAVVGRYILHPRVFDLLRHLPPGAGGEIQLTDGIAALLNIEPVDCFRFEGRRFDCGNALGVVEATMAFALERPDLAPEVRAMMRKLLAETE